MLTFYISLQTTYENFRYRADNRVNVYDQGCPVNFLEVFCSKIKPSRNSFRAYVSGMTATATGGGLADEEPAATEPRAKVEDDLELGGDLLKISQRRNYDEREEDFGSNGLGVGAAGFEREYEGDLALPSGQGDVRHSSWSRRRSGSWDISPEILGMKGLEGGGAASSSRGPSHLR